jgi:RNA polymerase sigma factor (sigma-70 family)
MAAAAGGQVMTVARNGTGLRDLRALFDVGSLAGLTDGQLLERFTVGGSELAELAFGALVDRHGPMLWRACMQILRDPHAAEDAVQATFLVLARNGRSLWVCDSLGPWLHRVACRIAIRAKSVARRRALAERRAALLTRFEWHDAKLDDAGGMIHEEIDRLPERYRAAIVLCDLEGRSYEESARHLGCPVGTVKSRLARGRERLKLRLTRRGLEPGAVALALRPFATIAIGGSEGWSSDLRHAAARSAKASAISVEPGTSSMTSLPRGAANLMLASKVGAAVIGMMCTALAAAAVAWRLQERPQAAQGAPAAPAKKEQERTLAWRRVDRYEPPDFEAYFPDDPQGAAKLKALWEAKDRDARPVAEVISTVRQGLRRAEYEVQSEVIRWVGQRYVWGQSPQNDEAIELMYHASDIPGDPEYASSLCHWAAYFGISTVRPLTPAILHALADSCMRSDEHNNLWRVAWAVNGQQVEFLAYLKPYRESNDQAVRAKAAAVEQIMKGELDAGNWWYEQKARKVRTKFGDLFPELRRTLKEGTSGQRTTVLETIERDEITYALDATFIEPFRACAGDKDPAVRVKVAEHLGAFFRGGEPLENGALELALRLAADREPAVVSLAVSRGLLDLVDKPEAVVRALVMYAISADDQELYTKIKNELEGDRGTTAKILDEVVRGPDKSTATRARAVYRELTGRKSDGDTKIDASKQAAYEKALRDLYEYLGRVYPSFQLKGIDWPAVGKSILPRVRAVRDDTDFGLLVEELVARLEDSHAIVTAGSAVPPTPSLPRWDPGFACLTDDRGRPVIYSVDRGSPAEKAGLKPGMTVVSIDGVAADALIERCMERLRTCFGYSSERYLRYDAVRNFARQPRRGSKVAIVVELVGGDTRNLAAQASLGVRYLPRLPVPRKGIVDDGNASWINLDDRTGYIYVRRIRGDLERALDQAIRGMPGITGLIIDVRGNSGGGFDTNTAFLNFDAEAKSTDQPARPRYTGPIALLIDERTISAGEGWASWFIAKKRARVFGTTSAGASARKQTYTLSNGLYKVEVPVKAYTGFLDRPIERRGLEPDVTVRPTAGDIARGRDTVVETAVEWLKQTRSR